MTTAGIKPSGNDANVSVYRIDTNFTTTSAIDYDTMIVSANARFSLQDINFIRSYKLIKDGSFVVVGEQRRRVERVSDINRFTAQTKVKYINLPGDDFIITSDEASNLDLLENSGYTMFLDQPQITTNPGRTIADGAIRKVYTHLNLLSPLIDYNVSAFAFVGGSTNGNLDDMSAYVDDLSGPPIVALDFPSNGPLNDFSSSFSKTITEILTAHNTPNKELVWSFTDLTKNPKDWFDPSDTQDIFTLKKEKGYWINVKDYNSVALSVDSSSRMSFSVTSHFDNNVTVSGSSKVGLVTNHIDHRLSLKINGLNPLENSAYDVTAIIKVKNFR